MRENSKYIGKVFEGRFKVVERDKSYIILENIYNKERIEICDASFDNLIKGKTTISNILRMRIWRTDRKHFGVNRTGRKK